MGNNYSNRSPIRLMIYFMSCVVGNILLLVYTNKSMYSINKIGMLFNIILLIFLILEIILIAKKKWFVK